MASASIERKKGEVAEWLKAAVSKTAILSNRDRGFESHPLRQQGKSYKRLTRKNGENVAVIHFGIALQLIF